MNFPRSKSIQLELCRTYTFGVMTKENFDPSSGKGKTVFPLFIIKIAAVLTFIGIWI
jgi:hypothetical protein